MNADRRRIWEHNALPIAPSIWWTEAENEYFLTKIWSDETDYDCTAKMFLHEHIYQIQPLSTYICYHSVESLVLKMWPKAIWNTQCKTFITASNNNTNSSCWLNWQCNFRSSCVVNATWQVAQSIRLWHAFSCRVRPRERPNDAEQVAHK